MPPNHIRNEGRGAVTTILRMLLESSPILLWRAPSTNRTRAELHTKRLGDVPPFPVGILIEAAPSFRTFCESMGGVVAIS